MAENDDFWTKDRCRLLVRQLQYHPALWDKFHPDYKKKVVKHDSRMELARLLETDAVSVESKLKTIVAQFRREIKKQKTIKTGSAAGERYVSMWYLLPELSYLLTPAEIRNTNDSNNPEDMFIEVHHASEDPTLHDDANDESEDAIRIAEENDRFQDEVEGLSQVGSTPNSTVSIRRPSAPGRVPEKRKLDDELSKAMTTLANSLAAPLPTTNINPEDEFDLLGRLVAKKVRGLKNRALQMKCENEINMLLFQAQAEDAGCGIVYVSNESIPTAHDNAS